MTEGTTRMEGEDQQQSLSGDVIMCGQFLEVVVPVLNTTEVLVSAKGLRFGPRSESDPHLWEWEALATMLRPAPARGELFCWGAVTSGQEGLRSVFISGSWREIWSSLRPEDQLQPASENEPLWKRIARDGSEETVETFMIVLRTRVEDRLTAPLNENQREFVDDVFGCSVRLELARALRGFSVARGFDVKEKAHTITAETPWGQIAFDVLNAHLLMKVMGLITLDALTLYIVAEFHDQVKALKDATERLNKK